MYIGKLSYSNPVSNKVGSVSYLLLVPETRLLDQKPYGVRDKKENTRSEIYWNILWASKIHQYSMTNFHIIVALQIT